MSQRPSTDPVCGMTPKPDSPHHHVHGGVDYRFCSAKCKARFVSDPARFLEADADPASAPDPAPAKGPRRRGLHLPHAPRGQAEGPRELPHLRHEPGADGPGGRGAPIQKLADRVAAYFVPAVLLASAATFAGWALFGPEPSMAYALINAVAVLIIACPCALGLATPMSIMVATGKAASMGVLFKDADAIETLGKVDTLVVDKTGTLTVGRPALTEVVVLEGEEPALLADAAALERGSEHPLAAAIVAAAKERGAPALEATGFQSITGKGVSGQVEGRAVALGNPALMESLGVDPSAGIDKAEGMRAEAQTVVFLAIDGRLAGLLGVSDPINESTPAAIAALHKEGLRVVMITGDSETTARAVAAKLGIDEVVAGVLPEGKADWVAQRTAAGHSVAMAGDGINDAPALARAAVGIAMGTGTDVAMESAGVTLVKGDLLGIVRARRLSRLTMSNIRQNLFFAFFYNIAGIPIAAGVLYPFFGLLLSPMLAAGAMSLSSVSVIANALRLRYAQV